MTIMKIIIGHFLLYIMCYGLLNFIESNLNNYDIIWFLIIFVSLPLSFILNLWSYGDLPKPNRKACIRSGLISAFISPFSFFVYLIIFVNIVGYNC